MRKETIGKIEVAKRQLNEAIQMFFDKRGGVSIHALAAAAAQVLTDLCKSRGVGMPLRDGQMIRADRRKEWRQAIKASENFFKRASTTACATLCMPLAQFRPSMCSSG